MKHKGFFKRMLVATLAIAVLPIMFLIGSAVGIIPSGKTTQNAMAASSYSIKYQAHVQSIGWQNWVTDGGMAGTTGRSLRMEAISIALVGTGLSGSVEYRTHVQNIGWMSWVKDGAISGTTGQSLRAEAISIRLTGDLANTYDIYYRTHIQDVGWMGWAKNGANAGSESFGLRMEALEIRLVAKGGVAPGSTNMPMKKPVMSLIARAHVQNIGWQGWVNEGGTSGTTGQGLRMEALCLSIANPDYTGSVEYRANVAGVGWQAWKSDGATAGTTGQGRQMEAVQIRLTGEIATKYDIYYRVHAAGIGWMGWAKNGDNAGTAGLSYRLEAIQVRLITKGGAAPGSTANAYQEINLTAQASVAGLGWLSAVSAGSTVGTTGQSRQLEAFKITASGNVSGGIEYQAYTQDSWTPWVTNGAIAGTMGKHIEAIRIRLTGDLANKYDIYYRVHSASVGWLGWASNGADAGTDRLNLRAEAFQMVVVPKGFPAPGSSYRAFINKLYENPINAPAIDQRAHGLPTGCEITAVAIMLSGYLGWWVNPVTLANQMPYHGSNPNYGYVGNPFSYSGWTIYPPALVNLVRSYAGSGVDLTGASYATLRSYIDQGKPVVVWTTMHGFTVHAITLTGYDTGGWYYNDPWTGSKNSWMSQSTLNSVWGSQSWRALSI